MRRFLNFTYLWVTLAVGIVSGIGGTALALLLHAIQHWAYGYELYDMTSEMTFLQGVQASSDLRRVSVLTLCGIVAGFGWWLLYRYLPKPVSIPSVVHSSKPRMPAVTMILHSLLQIITVGLGSPLGREVAPREVGALFANWLACKTHLTLKDTQIMIACGAGAGLAAVYNVPFGGVFFVLEGLIGSFRWPVVLPAITTSGIAVLISWLGLGNQPTYHNIAPLNINASLVVWSVLVGPIFGLTAFWFNTIALKARDMAKHNWEQIVLCMANFIIIGLLSIYFPALLGNGKSPAELEFSGLIGLYLTIALLILRTLIVWSSFRAGAHGGLLTPSVANGALLGVLMSYGWNFIWPVSPPGAYAMIGATAFLAAAQRMPITAMVLMLEFTRMNFNFLIPMFFSTVGALMAVNWLQSKKDARPSIIN